jgi:hypothetical protein
MPNTIAGVNLAAIAQESLPALQNLFAPLGALATDFSTDILASGASVTTRYPVRPTAVDLSSGYTPQGVETVSKTITLSSFQGFPYGFNDLERSKSAINLNDLFIDPALQATGKKVFADLWDLITSSNFTASTLITAGNFDRDDLADLRATLNAAGAPQQGRAVVLSPTYFASLVKSLNTAEFPGFIREKTEGYIPRVAGFDIYETDLADNNGQALGGFAFHKSALLMAARRVDASGAQQMGTEVADVVVPGLNLPVQFRRFYDNNAGSLNYVFGVFYGFQTGRTELGVRITSA